MGGSTSVLIVALGAIATALATGLGPLPLLWRRVVGGGLQGGANAVAAGVMVAASAGLLVEGQAWNPGRTAVGAILGAAFVVAVSRFIPEGGGRSFAGISGAGGARVLLIVVVMTAHSAAEGIGVGVAYGGGDTLGVTTTIAIALHNIPEGLAIALVMVPRGASVAAASFWSVVSSLPQPLLAVPAFLLVGWSIAALPVGLGFAAGAMIWMALFQLIPDSLATAGRRQVWSAGIGAFLAVVLLQILVAT